jgi:hypothetical protein
MGWMAKLDLTGRATLVRYTLRWVLLEGEKQETIPPATVDELGGGLLEMLVSGRG